MANRDYYEVLGLSPEADLTRIKQAYRGLAFQYHPDRNQSDPAAVEKMKEINEAYAILSDEGKKSRYDSLRQSYGTSAHDRFRQGYSEEDIFRGSDINQIFEDMAKNFGFRGFEEVFQQTYGQGFRTFEFKRAGFSGKGFIIYGAGFGGRRGPNPVTQPEIPGILGKAFGFLLKKAFGLSGSAEDKDVQDVLPIDSRLAVDGGKTLYRDGNSGRELAITIPAGIKEGQKIRLKGMGRKEAGLDSPGDLYLTVEIRKPLFQKVWKLLGG
jgi:DnaJ-class molecular chaperone